MTHFHFVQGTQCILYSVELEIKIEIIIIIKDIWLSAVAVDDGQWHVARVSRYGSAATLELDGGEGRRYNETFEFVGHQWLLVDKQEGVFAGGKAEYTGVRTFEVYADYQKGNLQILFAFILCDSKSLYS